MFKKTINLYKENLELKRELDTLKKQTILSPMGNRLYVNGKVNDILSIEEKRAFQYVVNTPVFQRLFNDIIVSTMEEMSAIEPKENSQWEYSVKHTELKVAKKFISIFNTLSS